MARFVLLLVLIIIVSRMFWRLVDSFIEGATGQPRRPRAPERGVPMARDPVCGTFVVPERAVSLVNGRTRLFFCSETCRDKYRAKTA
jgi:YHS domain-containing protein